MLHTFQLPTKDTELINMREERIKLSGKVQNGVVLGSLYW